MYYEINLFPGIRLGKTRRHITFTDVARELVPGQYQIWPYRFRKKDKNGAFFVLPPYSRTNIAHIVDESTQVKLEVVYGSGTCPFARNRGVTDLQLSAETYLQFGKDVIYALKAGREGLVVREEVNPPFRLGVTEVNLTMDDPHAPSEFWKIVNTPLK